MGYSPWGCKESDTTEQLHLLHSLRQPIQESNGLCWAYSPWRGGSRSLGLAGEAAEAGSVPGSSVQGWLCSRMRSDEGLMPWLGCVCVSFMFLLFVTLSPDSWCLFCMC